jgi:transposase
VIGKETEAEILRLFHAEKWRIGTIAEQLHVHHTTVQRVLNQAGVESKQVAPRPSLIDPYLPFVLEQLTKYPGLRASRLFEMIQQRGYSGGPDHFRRIVAQHRPRKPAEAFQRLKTLPGEQAQVDWAHFGKLTIGKAVRVLWAFVMVLSYSRQLFLRFFLSSTMPFFLRGHIDAFSAWNGVPRVLLYDNLKSAVLERQGEVIRLNPMLIDLAAHYRFEVRPVAVARGNEKGRVERAIRYIRDAFFAARKFVDLADLNRQALEWATERAAARPWVEDRTRLVRDVFAEEQSKLLPLPDDHFPAHDRVEVDIGKTPYARFDLNDYSVPHDRVRRSLTVVADLETVRILDGTDVVAVHVRSWDRDQQIEQGDHLARLAQEKRRARDNRGVDRLGKAAPASKTFLHLLAQRGQNVGSVTARLLALLDWAGAAELEEALVEVLERDTIHVGAVRQVLDRRRNERGLPPPVLLPLAPSAHRDLVVSPHSLSSYDRLTPEDDHGE